MGGSTPMNFWNYRNKENIPTSTEILGTRQSLIPTASTDSLTVNITGIHTRACFDTRWSPLSHDIAASRRGTLLFFSNVPR